MTFIEDRGTSRSKSTTCDTETAVFAASDDGMGGPPTVFNGAVLKTSPSYRGESFLFFSLFPFLSYDLSHVVCFLFSIHLCVT